MKNISRLHISEETYRRITMGVSKDTSIDNAADASREISMDTSMKICIDVPT